MQLLGLTVDTDQLQSTALLESCCLDTPPGFVFTFDRVIASTGAGMDTTMLFDPAPAWAVGELRAQSRSARGWADASLFILVVELFEKVWPSEI